MTFREPFNLGGIQKLREQNFNDFWPPSPCHHMSSLAHPLYEIAYWFKMFANESFPINILLMVWKSIYIVDIQSKHCSAGHPEQSYFSCLNDISIIKHAIYGWQSWWCHIYQSVILPPMAKFVIICHHFTDTPSPNLLT